MSDDVIRTAAANAGIRKYLWQEVPSVRKLEQAKLQSSRNDGLTPALMQAVNQAVVDAYRKGREDG